MTFSSPADPYRDRKKYHMAGKMDARGHVSALCFSRPRAINLRQALWTLRKEAVTCPACLRLLSTETTA